ncbi:MAG: cation:proton antiporter, partial [Planctomycetes bacterium]|nr:cation:proton antiporter [Planctomycetota bacterium]
LFQKLHIPQIVGYVAIGIVLGPVLKVFSNGTIQMFEPFNLYALGIIGFLIGGELKREVFARLGKQVLAILLFEGLTAFVLVGLLSFAVMICFSDWQMALAVSVVFGAICSATDPASTVSVLWEYKARGPLTTMLTAIVALDDALALVLYAVGVSVAGVITGHQETGFIFALVHSFYEIVGSLAMGIAAGWILNWILKRIDDNEKVLVFTISSALLVVGMAIRLNLDVILSSMALGLTLINSKSNKAKISFSLLRNFSAPIYVLFFVLVGARLDVSNVTKMIWLLVAAYVIGSVVGKTAGAYWGSVYCGAVKTVRKYLGFCLYPQGGIAVGLLIMASQKFDQNISSIMLLVIIIGAFILQIIGPIGVKIGAGKAGELGLNVTEEDLIKTYKVGDIMNAKMPVLSAGTSLSEVIKVVSTTENFYYCVIDSDENLIGAITLDGIRNMFATQELNDWLVALDIVEPIVATITADIPLGDGLDKMKKFEVEYLPVVVSQEANKLSGLLTARAVHRQLSAEVLAKQSEADRMYGLGVTSKV